MKIETFEKFLPLHNEQWQLAKCRQQFVRMLRDGDSGKKKINRVEKLYVDFRIEFQLNK